MLVKFQDILKDANESGYAVPAFNVYNMETVMGVIAAAEETRSPVIMQFYSRLATTGFADYLAPVILKAAEKASVPVCMHLDHGSGYEAAAIALKNGATGIMVDFSTLPLSENIEKTAKAVSVLKAAGVGVEGEIGHIGKAADGVPTDYTTVEEAKTYVAGTGVSALAVAVGTAHGRYKQAPSLAIERIKEINKSYEADEDYIFINEDGRRWQRGIDNTLRVLCREANIPEKSFHDIRRTVASEMYENGRTLEEIRDYLGHRDILTTQGYIYRLKRQSEYASAVHESLKANELELEG